MLTCPSCGAAVTAKTLTYAQAAALMGISERWFYRLKRRGKFRGLESKIPRRLSRDKVEDFCRNGGRINRHRGDLGK